MEDGFALGVTAALDKEPGALCDWISDLWRAGHDVAVYTLQEGIMPKDHAMFEQYWIGQFADLLNVAGNWPAVAATSTVGKQVIAAIQAQIERARTTP